MSNMDDIYDAAFVGAPGDKILLPLMGYPSERDAIFIALVTAEYFGSDLHVFHVESKNQEAERFFKEQIIWLQEKAKKMNVNVDIIIKEQLFNLRLHQVILNEIEIINPNSTFMMSRRKGIFQKFRGSIAERVARASPTSVVIIRSPIKDWTTYGDHLEPRRIIVPIGTDSPCELFATQLAIALANAGKTEDAEIILLHVIVIPETVPIDTANDEMLVDQELKFIKQAGKFSTLLLFPMQSKVLIGRDIGRSVSQYVNKVHADMVVMGVPYLPRKFLGLYGTDTNEIYHKSKCPVAMIFRKKC